MEIFLTQEDKQMENSNTAMSAPCSGSTAKCPYNYNHLTQRLKLLHFGTSTSNYYIKLNNTTANFQSRIQTMVYN
jgi:hypothetical protein